MKFTLHKSATATNQKFWWVLKSANNETLCQSEMYATKASAQHSLNLVKGGAGGATVLDLT